MFIIEKRILLYENAAESFQTLYQELHNLDMEIHLQIAESAMEIMDYVSRFTFIMVIFAIRASTPDYVSWIKAIRNHSSAPIVILSASSAPDDEVTFLKAGADRFLSVGSPADISRCIANIHSMLGLVSRLLYRMHQNASSYGNNIKINHRLRRVYINGQNLCLTQKQFSILGCLINHVGEIVTKEQLYQEIWRDNLDINADEALKYHIKELRKKLRNHNRGDLIETVRGMGYLIAFKES